MALLVVDDGRTGFTIQPMDETSLQKWQREEVAKKAAFRLSHPNHRLITRGSRKGQIVRLTKADRRKERRLELDRRKSEAPPVLPVTSINTKTATKTREYARRCKTRPQCAA